MTKNFVWEAFSVSLKSGIQKVYASEVYVTIFRRKLFVSQHRNIPKRKPSVLCFGNFPVAKNYWRKEAGMRKGISRLSVRKSLSNSTKKFRRGSILCFKKFQLSKNVQPKKEISRFSVKNFLPHSAENFRRVIV